MAGLPHSEIRGSKGARPSPRLIAACHVLHRLSVPRHPSNALESLDRSSLAFMHGENRATAESRDTQSRHALNALDDVKVHPRVSTDGARKRNGRTLLHD